MQEQRNKDFYEPLTMLPTRGGVILEAIKRTALFFHRTLNRQLGLWRVVDLGSRAYRNWAQCPVVGPDGDRLYIDLRGKGFGLVTTGYGVSEILPLINLLRDDAIILDVGANIGIWARLFARRAHCGKIYAFEPSPSTLSLLELNCIEHKNISCVPIALGNASGTEAFVESAEPGIRHLALTSDANQITAMIRVMTLDDWVEQVHIERIDFIKIDVEGFEEDILDKARNTIAKLKPVVFFEFIPHLTLARSRFGGRMIFEFFRMYNYTVSRLDKSGLLHIDFMKPEDWTNDYVAIPNGSAYEVSFKYLQR